MMWIGCITKRCYFLALTFECLSNSVLLAVRAHSSHRWTQVIELWKLCQFASGHSGPKRTLLFPRESRLSSKTALCLPSLWQRENNLKKKWEVCWVFRLALCVLLAKDKWGWRKTLPLHIMSIHVIKEQHTAQIDLF